MNNEQMASWIMRRLGAPVIKVELTADHLCDDIEQAIRWFSAKKGVKKQAVMRTYSGKSDYILPDEVDTVLDVIFQIPPMDISLIFAPFILVDEKVPYDVFAAPSSVGIYSSFTQTLQYINTAKRVLGAEPDWRQDGRTLLLFPVPKNDTAVVLDFKSHLLTIDQLNERDHDLVKRYALAKAKMDLGRIRSKYDSFPTAQGTTTLDGNTLLDEAKTEIEALEEEIALSGYPMPWISG
jgi:hypothetical protein